MTRELKVFLLLLGFLSGNLFGTLLDFLRKFLVWDGLIIAILITMGEAISLISYKRSSTNQPYFRIAYMRASLPFFSFQPLFLKNWVVALPYLPRRGTATEGDSTPKNFGSFFNFFKIGVMIGFFVDAFKVGS